MPRVNAYAGEYDKYITVYKNDPARSANTDGQRPEDDKEHCKRWGSVSPMRATEQLLSQQVRGTVTHEVRMRRDSVTKSITSGFWLVLTDGTRLNVVGGPFDIGSRKMELMFTCRERQ